MEGAETNSAIFILHDELLGGWVSSHRNKVNAVPIATLVGKVVPKMRLLLLLLLLLGGRLAMC